MEEEYNQPSTNSENNNSKNNENGDETYHVVPGVPVVRSNTPRPVPFDLVVSKTELPLPPSKGLADFPSEAPTAPPLPEETGRESSQEKELADPQTPLPLHEVTDPTLSGDF